MIGIESITETLIICQTQKVLILLARNEDLGLSRLSSKQLNWRKANQCRMWLAWTSDNTWYTAFLGFANFYPQFIQEFSRLATLPTFMLKIALVTGPENENPDQDDKKI